MHVIGTAGHVDHGKSTLVQALTGIDPDRLAEEKARQMTIDLGFAWLTLGDEEVGIVDVPGHRDFIENMLAGVGGIDLALFVVAADEGVMPQTREHLAILDLLEVRRGVVALTKVDLVDDPDWLELVTLEVADALQPTALAGAPLIPVSARTGQGLPELRAALTGALGQIAPAADLGRPRLPIDRVFTLAGFGTVVTGTLIDGRLRVGDDVEAQPGALAGRVRGLQTHKTKRDTALPGSRVAVNVTGIDRSALRRGQVLAARGVLRPTMLLDTQYRQLPDAGPLAHNDEVKLFVGADEVTARARVMGLEPVAPGAMGWVQLALSEPVAVARGDRFILRRPSPGMTLGGGRVLDANPGRRHRRLRPDVADRFLTLAEGTPEERLARALSGAGPLPVADALRRAGLTEEDGRATLQTLLDAGHLLTVGKSVVTSTHWERLLEQALAALSRFHAEAPLRPGMEREDLRSRLTLLPPLFTALRESLLARGEIVEQGTLLRLPGHAVRFSADQEQAIAHLEVALQAAGVNSPSVKECKTMVGEAVYQALVELGRLRPISEDVVYQTPTAARLVSQLESHLQARGTITAAEARELLNTSRKYAIALLEHLDELRITRRVGDARELVRPSNLTK